MSSGSLLIKPSQLDQLPVLSAEQKTNYRQGLETLWNVVESHPQGSQEQKQALERIHVASQKIMLNINQRQQRPVSQGQPGQGQQGGMSGLQQSNMGGQQQGGMGPSGVVPGGGMGSQRQAPQQGQQPGSSQQGGLVGQQGTGGQQQLATQLSEKAQTFFRSLKIYPRHNMNPNTPEYEQYNGQIRKAMQEQVFKQERASRNSAQIQTRIQASSAAGQEITQQWQDQYRNLVQQSQEAQAAFKRLQAENETNRLRFLERQTTAAASQQGGGGAVNGPQGGQQRPTSQQQSMPNQAGMNGDVNMNDSRHSLSPPQPQGGATFQQQNAPSNMGNHQQNSTQGPQQTPQSATNPQLTQPPNITFNQNQQQNNTMAQPARPLPSPHQQTQQPNLPPKQNNSAPNSAVTQGPAQPLSQQAAMEAAARSYSEQQQAQHAQQSMQNTPAGQQLPNQNKSNGHQRTPTSASGFPSMATPSMNSINTKMPIPKQLNIPPNVPVQMPNARPTLTQSGMANQPAIPKPPGFVLEGDGEHVLSRKKLDELVRQVTGGGEHDGLAPDVAESMLGLMDTFVDDVITSACRLAKLRSTQTLDIRDLQLTLERNYGIRIPGYALDEVRTVRKFQPSAGWTQKMNAVQAAKVMGKNADL